MKNIERSQEVSGTMFDILENISGRTYAWLALGSILLSAFLFLSGRRNWSLFVGQWPPTFLATALFFRLLHPSREPGELSGLRSAAEESQRRMGQTGQQGSMGS